MKLPFQEKEGYWTRYLADDYVAYLASLMLDCPSENCIVIGKLGTYFPHPSETLTESTQLAAIQPSALPFVRKPPRRSSQLCSLLRCSIAPAGRRPGPQMKKPTWGRKQTATDAPSSGFRAGQEKRGCGKAQVFHKREKSWRKSN